MRGAFFTTNDLGCRIHRFQNLGCWVKALQFCGSRVCDFRVKSLGPELYGSGSTESLHFLVGYVKFKPRTAVAVVVI